MLEVLLGLDPSMSNPKASGVPARGAMGIGCRFQVFFWVLKVQRVAGLRV